MRFLLLFVITACAARQTPTSAPADTNAPYRVSAEHERKLSAYLIQQWRDYGLSRGEYTPIIITIRGDARTATAALVDFGAGYVRPVTTSPAAAGTLHALSLIHI